MSVLISFWTNSDDSWSVVSLGIKIHAPDQMGHSNLLKKSYELWMSLRIINKHLMTGPSGNI